MGGKQDNQVGLATSYGSGQDLRAHAEPVWRIVWAGELLLIRFHVNCGKSSPVSRF